MFVRNTSPRLKPSLTPLIDLVFLLVVFFMLNTSFVREEAINLQFLQQTTGEPSSQNDEENTVHLQLYDAQHIGFEGRQMTRAELHKTLTPLLTENPDRTITIESMDGAVVQDVIVIMDDLKKQGGRNVSLIRPFK